jgi:hypothetical protein
MVSGSLRTEFFHISRITFTFYFLLSSIETGLQLFKPWLGVENIEYCCLVFVGRNISLMI